MKVAILITGELRVPDFENFYNSVKNYDIYISTYSEYYNIAKKITNNIIITNINDIYVKYTNIYQWWHLNKLLVEYKEIFKTYDILFKTRSDCYFIEPLTNKHFMDIDLSCFYMNSDHSFYSSVKLFYKIYENYYNDILNIYIDNGNTYFDINYNNLVASYENIQTTNKYLKYQTDKKYRHIRQDFHQGIRELVYPESIYSRNTDILIKNIKDFKFLNKNIDNKKYFNGNASGNPNFGSEKYNFLNAVNKAVIKKFNLPTIGVISPIPVKKIYQ